MGVRMAQVYLSETLRRVMMMVAMMSMVRHTDSIWYTFNCRVDESLMVMASAIMMMMVCPTDSGWHRFSNQIYYAWR